MTLTTEEEQILKAMVAERKANFARNEVATEMGVAIRSEFSRIDAQKRAEYKNSLDAKTQAVTDAQSALNNVLKSATQ